MDEEIKAQIIPIIEGTKEGLAKAVDFLCEQSPILVKEILWWCGLESALYWLFGLLLVVFAAIVLGKRFIAGAHNLAEEQCDEFIIIAAWSIRIGTGVAGLLFMANLTWLKILIAPRLFLLEFMKDAIV